MGIRIESCEVRVQGSGLKFSVWSGIQSQRLRDEPTHPPPFAQPEHRPNAQPRTWQSIGDLFKGVTPRRSSAQGYPHPSSSPPPPSPAPLPSVSEEAHSLSPNPSEAHSLSCASTLSPCAPEEAHSLSQFSRTSPPGGPASPPPRRNAVSEEASSPRPPHPAEALSTPRDDILTPLPRAIHLTSKSPPTALYTPLRRSPPQQGGARGGGRSPASTPPSRRGDYDTPGGTPNTGCAAASPPPRIASSNTPTAYFFSISQAITANPVNATKRAAESPSQNLTW